MRESTHLVTRWIRAAVGLFVALALAGCAAGAEPATTTSTPASNSTSTTSTPTSPPAAGLPVAEVYDLLIACMAEEGWHGEVRDGGIQFSGTPPDQRPALREAMAECEREVGLPDPSTFTEEDLRRQHAFKVDLRECLVDEGYDLPPAPTVEAFLDMQGAWTPYGDMFHLGFADDHAEWTRLQVVCPQDPNTPRP